ncbi:MAG: hypothetical protein ACOC24_06970 [Desulfovibrionales bacterium]
MLLIRCAGCKAKLFRYRKIGPGAVLRCHKARITRVFDASLEGDLQCSCGRIVGVDAGTFYKMINSRFTSSGTKCPGP